jgi:hypothetical protein|tara:strand:+ start:1720 stop:2013 length:294 start_codon:yes stop_codon:yes gene_type:complete
MADDNDFNSRVFGVVPTSFTPGFELHIMTSEAYNDRVLNLRLNRVIPSVRGYVGYTKQGFMLSRDEARMLLDKLVEVIHDDDAWEDEPDSVVVIEDD